MQLLTRRPDIVTWKTLECPPICHFILQLLLYGHQTVSPATWCASSSFLINKFYYQQPECAACRPSFAVCVLQKGGGRGQGTIVSSEVVKIGSSFKRWCGRPWERQRRAANGRQLPRHQPNVAAPPPTGDLHSTSPFAKLLIA